jgi:hypothetical protein
MGPIPENYTDFLYWLKNQTENYWSQDPKTTTNEDKCPQWAYGAKWIGMTDEQIDHVQEKYSIIFTPEHREFLRILHTIDRKEKVYSEYGSEEGEYYECSFFRNWLEDYEEIRLRLPSVYEPISEDVANNKFWINSWGKRYDTVEDRMNIFNKLYEKAPKLVPVMGHRFQVADLSLDKRPVLSILGTDVVFYGSDFRFYLLQEIREHLNIYHREYDEEDKTWYWTLNKEYSNIFEYFDKTKLPDTPFWKSFFLFDWTDHNNNVNL